MNDATRPSAERSGAPEQPVPASEPEPQVEFNWRKNAMLFVATVASVFFVGRFGLVGSTWRAAFEFAVPLLAILVAHEFGHYIAARLHRVPASLPYFLPLPIFNPFGTLGAVIVMPQRIKTRRALLDIGASGPLAGMALAIPLMLYGLSQSEVLPRTDSNYIQEGQSILYFAVKYWVFGTIPADQDVFLHPTAFAAWGGFFLTFLNLLPFGQLDGGHVAYALLGKRQNRIAPWLLLLVPVLIVYNCWLYLLPVLRLGISQGFDKVSPQNWATASSILTWVILFVLLLLMKRWVGAGHPPVDDPELSPLRYGVGIVTLALFVLLFMPSPLVAF